jgi:hypothetical protein
MQQRRIHASRHRIEDHEAILTACERIGPGIASEWLDWIERAAVAGSAAARVQYWNYVADHYTDAASVIRDADNAVRRRGLARAWLAAELARGNGRFIGPLRLQYPPLPRTPR